MLEFGKVKRVVKDAGLHFKVPFVQNIVRFDKRIQDLNAKPTEVILSGQKRLVVDAFIKYRIADPLEFYKAEKVPGSNRKLLDTHLDSSLRQVMASVALDTLLTGERSKIMQQITQAVVEKAKPLGIEVVDVRVMRADFPKENSENVYQEMNTDRYKVAKELRAKGEEEAKRIRATAEKERTILLAEAEKTAQITRGEGDAEATRITAEAYSRDADFYNFYRSLQAYSQTLQKDNTSMVLSPDSEFLRYFNNIKGSRSKQ